MEELNTLIKIEDLYNLTSCTQVAQTRLRGPRVFIHVDHSGQFAIYTRARDPNRRIYLRPTQPERSGAPWRNRILGHDLLRREFNSRDNYVFQRGPRPRNDCESTDSSDSKLEGGLLSEETSNTSHPRE